MIEYEHRFAVSNSSEYDELKGLIKIFVDNEFIVEGPKRVKTPTEHLYVKVKGSKNDFKLLTIAQLIRLNKLILDK